MITLFATFTLINGGLMVFSSWVGVQLWNAGHHAMAMVCAVVVAVMAIATFGQLLGNLLEEYRHRKKHYSDLPHYVWLSPKSELFGVDKNGRPIARGSIRRDYR